MQQETPKWLTHFTTAFGTSGVIALAWWVGARNAVEIRDMQRSYPFLRIVPAGSDPLDVNDLLGTLSVLSGAKDADVISRAKHAPAALKRALFDDTNLPLVLTEMGGPGDHFDDWSMLKPMFNNCSSSSITPSIDVTASDKRSARGLVFVAERGAGPGLPSRTVELSIDLKCLAGAMKLAGQVLQHRPSDGHDMLSLDPTAWRQMVYRLGGIEQHIDSMTDDLGKALSHRHAMNHAQLICMVHVLVDAFHLPEDVASNAIRNIHDMAAGTVDIPF
ncbi:hypothetical protein [Pseudomonas huaxiensis]|uniref:hypothetical protein n=1 Tax=Pseudomonas huaxiensis TaxID=2213017 RepID=UPI000DA6C1B6|nr:hypothetical protein [Pseudomonas huaxiensis]